jgi:type IV pilus assembly protein PilB
MSHIPADEEEDRPGSTKAEEREQQGRHARQQLGEILIGRGVITPAQLTQALETQRMNRKRLGDNLRAMGISSESIAEALSEQLGIPLVRLTGVSLKESVLQCLPEAFARRHQAIPIGLTDMDITIAMVDPLDVLTVDDIHRLTGRKVKVAITTAEDFNMAINQYPALDESMEEALKDFVVTAERDKEPTVDSIMQMVQETPIVRLVSLIISRAVRDRASDIHIEPQRHHLRVRFRVDGLLTTVMTPPQRVQAAVISRIKILSSMNIAERRVPQDGRFEIKLDGKDIDIRVSAIPSVHGEKIVMRLLERSATSMTFDALGISQEDRSRLAAMVRRPHGMFMMTGPTGSGKTTTLYTILNMLNSPDRNIVTIEDPVEYHIAGITQVQVDPKAGVTFSGGLRSFLRQDPNIIMVGEVRDQETASLAVQAALTGHLVLSTLHTNDAPGAVTRLQDMGIESFRIAATLLGAAAQRLVRVLCPECKEPAVLTPEVAVRLGLELNNEPVQIFTPRGCALCGDTGYRGRIAVFELMHMTKEMKQLISAKAPEHEVREAAAKGGMRSLLEDGVQKILAGITSVEEVLRVLDAPAPERMGAAPKKPAKRRGKRLPATPPAPEDGPPAQAEPAAEKKQE